MPTKLVAFGEVLLRYSAPGREMLLQTPRLEVVVGGAEANVATALARLGHDVELVSAVPSNPLGDATVHELRGQGIATGNLIRSPGRMGIYYVATGAGRRPTEITYDRAGSSFATADSSSWDWSTILGRASHFHLSGITPALGPKGVENARAAIEAARNAGLIVSFDGNFRASLWALWDGKPAEILRSLVEQADILFGNHRDIALMLGQDFESSPERAAAAAFAAFPRLQVMAGTIRNLVDVSHHELSGRIDTRDGCVQTDPIAVTNIVDRIGAGDAFAAGVLHRWMQEPDAIETAARDGLALAVLKHSMPGDACLIRPRDLASFWDNSLEVQR